MTEQLTAFVEWAEQVLSAGVLERAELKKTVAEAEIRRKEAEAALKSAMLRLHEAKESLMVVQHEYDALKVKETQWVRDRDVISSKEEEFAQWKAAAEKDARAMSELQRQWKADKELLAMQENQVQNLQQELNQQIHRVESLEEQQRHTALRFAAEQSAMEERHQNELLKATDDAMVRHLRSEVQRLKSENASLLQKEHRHTTRSKSSATSNPILLDVWDRVTQNYASGKKQLHPR